MKILVAVPGNLKFGSKPNNGVAVISRNLNYELHQRFGHEITFCVSMQPGEQPEDWYDLIEIPDKRTHISWMINKLAEVSGDYDMIHLHGSFYSISSLAYQARTRPLEFKCPVFVTLHSPWVPGITANDFKARSSISSWDKLFHVVSLTDEVPHEMCDYYKKELDGKVLNYKLMPTLPKIEAEVPKVPRENRVTIIGRLDPVKNVINNLSKAIDDVRKHPGYVIDLVLNSKTTNSMTKANQYLATAANELIEANKDIINHYELLSRAEIGDLLARSRLLYHFTTFRSPDLVPMEANALGTPVAGYCEIVKHVDYDKNLLLSRNGTSGYDLVTKSPDLLEIANQYTEDDYDLTRRNFSEMYDTGKLTKEWNDYYVSIVGKK